MLSPAVQLAGPRVHAQVVEHRNMQRQARKGVLHSAAGVEERFGKEVLQHLEREGSVPMQWRGGRGRQPLCWTLTKQACSACRKHLPP